MSQSASTVRNHATRVACCGASAAALLASIMIATTYESHAAPAATVSLDAMVDRVKKDVAARHTASLEDIRIVSTAAVVWRDTSMGCGKPTESHAQIDVEGYRIVLEYEGQRFDYRARSDGYFVLCPRTLSTPR